jgi:phage terminase small subunit
MVLTAKQSTFVAEYLIDLNATQAAIRAGYSKGTADKQGPRLLSSPGVKAAIDAGKIKRSEKIGIDAEWVLQRLIEESEADLADIFDDNNNLKPIEAWPKIWRQGLVAGVEVDAFYEGHGKDRIQIGETKKVRLSERLRRVELIGKHVRVNAFQETVNVTGIDTLSDRMERAHQRLDRHAQTRAGDDAKLVAQSDEPALIAPSADVKPVHRETMLPGGMQQATAPVEKPALPVTPRPMPYLPYRPIMPSAPESAPWPAYGGRAKLEYDPLK